jgi:Flp pilus assembly protein TadG
LIPPKAKVCSLTRSLDESGAAYVEAAIVFAVLVPFLLYVASFGIAFYEWSEVTKLVETGVFFVAKNADALNAMDTFDASIITNAVGKDRFGESLTITAGCSCPTMSDSGISSLTPFQTGGAPKCDPTPQCNGDTTPMSPYVAINVAHPLRFTFGLSNLPSVSATAIVRIQ